MAAIVYIRVSTEEQATGYGLDAQRQQCVAYAQAFGLEIAAIYEDAGISGTKPANERPGLQAALAAITNGDADTLITPAIDRVGRRASIALSVWDEIEQAGAAIVAVKERIDTSTPAGKFARTMLAGVAELERDNIVSRTKAGRDARGRIDGEKGGAMPLGYTRVIVETRIDVDAAAAALVREIFERKQGGESLSAIARTLTERGEPTPKGGKRWYASTVRQILQNEHIYRGGNRGESKEQWPPILP